MLDEYNCLAYKFPIRSNLMLRFPNIQNHKFVVWFVLQLHNFCCNRSNHSIPSIVYLMKALTQFKLIIKAERTISNVEPVRWSIDSSIIFLNTHNLVHYIQLFQSDLQQWLLSIFHQCKFALLFLYHLRKFCCNQNILPTKKTLNMNVW